jgi:transcription elongation factor GreA
LSTTETPAGQVGLGSSVTVVDMVTNEQETFVVVLAEMMDIDAGHISLASPLGRALKGRKVGDEIALRLPHGQRQLRVVEIAQA